MIEFQAYSKTSKPNRKSPRLRAARLRRQRPYRYPPYGFTRRIPLNTTIGVREKKSEPSQETLKSFGPKPPEAWHVCISTFIFKTQPQKREVRENAKSRHIRRYRGNQSGLFSQQAYL